MAPRPLPSFKGRGARHDPPNRFHATRVEVDDDVEFDPEEEPPRGPATQLIPDVSRSVISENQSPDVGFEISLNPYRGCEHGCIYCYARPTHEYLGYSAGLDFETRILVKHEAPRLLREALLSPRYRPRTLALSGVTDPYQPAERELRLTRACLEVLAEMRHPVTIVTKSALVARDLDLLRDLARHQAVSVFVSVTTLDEGLAGVMEPRASRPRRRLRAIQALAEAGVPVGVIVGPILPGLTDHELPAILAAAGQAGASFASYTVVRLPHAVKDLFLDWLETHFPARKPKVLERLRSIRGGGLTDPRFGSRQRGEGPFAEQLAALFRVTCQRAGLSGPAPSLSSAAFRRVGPQRELF